MRNYLSVDKVKRHIKIFNTDEFTNSFQWNDISTRGPFQLEEIVEFQENINIYAVLQNNSFNMDEINYIVKNIKPEDNAIFYTLSYNQQLSDEFINDNIDKFRNVRVALLIDNNAKNMSESTLRKFDFDKSLYTSLLKTGKQLSDDFLKDYFKYNKSVSDHLQYGIKLSENVLNSINLTYSDYTDISEKLQLSDDFIDKHINSLKLYEQCKKFKLSEYVKDKYYDRIGLDNLCTFQELSLEFIEKYKDILPWRQFCNFQKLDEKIIEMYKDYVDWQMCYSYQDMSDEFIKKHDSYIKRIIRLNRYNKNNDLTGANNDIEVSE